MTKSCKSKNPPSPKHLPVRRTNFRVNWKGWEFVGRNFRVNWRLGEWMWCELTIGVWPLTLGCREPSENVFEIFFGGFEIIGSRRKGVRQAVRRRSPAVSGTPPVWQHFNIWHSYLNISPSPYPTYPYTKYLTQGHFFTCLYQDSSDYGLSSPDHFMGQDQIRWILCGARIRSHVWSLDFQEFRF